jgi:hypothetical protein
VYVKRREADAYVARNYVLAWQVDFVTPSGVVPLSVFVDAIAGDVAAVRLREYHCEAASGLTTWFGKQNFITTFDPSEGFLLQAACSVHHGATVTAVRPTTAIYSNADNNWDFNNRSGVTAYWGVRSALDYFG